MHDLYALKDTLIKELKGYGKSGDVSKSSLEMIDKLAHATKNLEKVIECCEEEEYSMGRGMDGYSRRGMSYRDGDRSADGVTNYGRYVRPDGSYADGGSSYARGRGRGAKRDAMGRYSSADDEMVMQLERLMDTAQDERTRSEIRKLIEKM